jgi:putative transposase
VWSWVITCFPTTVQGIWLYVHLVIEVCSRKVVGWDVAEQDGPPLQPIW